MCGIAGLASFAGDEPLEGVLAAMASALHHRGPDEGGVFVGDGVGLASRRLSIVDVESGQQPVSNEDGSVVAVFNGELFNHASERRRLSSRYRFRSLCDSEVLVHLWADQGERMFERLRGQFAFALFDRKRRTLILARDRFGICPLHWAAVGDEVCFASEVKAILASGRVAPRLDPLGVDHVFTFFGLPTRRTLFEGVRQVLPGCYLKVTDRGDGAAAISEHRYWDFDFPPEGEEVRAAPQEHVERFGEALTKSVARRLRADVPVVSYLSGGVDSATVAALSTKVRGEPIPTFTIKVCSRGFDEEHPARRIARHLGSRQTVVPCDSAALAGAYRDLIVAAESPVVDVSSAALLLLSREVHRQGYKVALTGEGSDEGFGSYAWFKVAKLLGRLLWPSAAAGARRLIGAVAAPDLDWSLLRRSYEQTGGMHAGCDLYGLMASSRSLFRAELRERLGGDSAFDDLPIDRQRIARWHPHNQSIYLGYRTILPGLLLCHKGDRVAMAHSVETRYPFLDEDVVDVLASVDPEWKLRGFFGDKALLRRFAASCLPGEVARTPKGMFRAPFGDAFFRGRVGFVEQLLSPESLDATGLFDAARIGQRIARRGLPIRPPGRRLFEEMGLAAAVATQLFCHLYLGGGLCDLPTWSPPSRSAVLS